MFYTVLGVAVILYGVSYYIVQHRRIAIYNNIERDGEELPGRVLQFARRAGGWAVRQGEFALRVSYPFGDTTRESVALTVFSVEEQRHYSPGTDVLLKQLSRYPGKVIVAGVPQKSFTHALTAGACVVFGIGAIIYSVL